MSKKTLLTGICTAVILFLSSFLSVYSFAASFDDSVEVSKLEMRIKNVTLQTGQDKTLHVTISPGKADDKTITWDSSDDSVVMVQDTGGSSATITSVGEGRAKITATSHNGKTAVCSVTVSDGDVKVSRIEMTTETATVRVNQIKTLLAEVYPDNATDKSIEWTSSNSEVVMVKGDGIIVGISPGTAEITATSHNGRTAVCAVTVPSAVLTGIEQPVQNKDILSAEARGGELLSAATLRLDVENAAKDDTKSKQIALTYSRKSQVSTAALRSAAFTAAYNSKEAVLRFRTLDDDGKIQGQLTLNPGDASKDDMYIRLGVYASAKQTENAKTKAEDYFGSPVAVVYLSQTNAFCMTVQVAAKADLTALDAETIKLYRYSGESYTLLETQEYYIDTNGYIHFTVSEGGIYVLVSA